MQFKDYYQILGVPREATAEDIKKSFRKLARKYHPDLSKGPDAELSMQVINEANTVLFDPETRVGALVGFLLEDLLPRRSLAINADIFLAM